MFLQYRTGNLLAIRSDTGAFCEPNNGLKRYIVRGISERCGCFYTEGMRIPWARFSLCAGALATALPLWASQTPMTKRDVVSQRIVAVEAVDDAAVIQQSLRRDVAKHPNDFVVFATETGANRFLVEHRDEVERETNGRLVWRGVVGYWQGKTLVVLPWEPVKSAQ
jgi:hypothetical protein